MKTLKILLMMLMTIPAFAQDNTEGLPKNLKAQEKIKAAEAAYITERLALTPEEAEKFWPVYREFDQKRQSLREQFKHARKARKTEKEMLDLEFKLKQDQLDLEKDYSQQFQKIISPQKLMNLLQAQSDFRRLLLRQIRERQNRADRLDRQRDGRQQRLRPRNN